MKWGGKSCFSEAQNTIESEQSFRYKLKSVIMRT